MKKFALYLILPAYLLSAASCFTGTSDSKRMAMKENEMKFAKNAGGDTKFAVCAADGSMLKTKMSELALSNAASPDVKRLARHIKDDHEQSSRELQALAAEKNITLPTELSKRSQKKYECLAKKEGEKFDKAYSKMMKKEHKKEVAAYKRMSKKGKDGDIKEWASEKVPVLEQHVDMSESAREVCCK